MAEDPKAEDPKGAEDTATWFKGVLEQANTKERQDFLKQGTRSFHEEEITAVTKRHDAVAAERTRYKKALELDADGIAALTKGDNLLNWAKDIAKRVGVSESTLKFARLPEDVQEMVEEHLAKASGGEPSKPPVTGGAPDLAALVKAELEKLGVKAPPAPVGEKLPSGVSRGTVGTTAYKELLRSGKPLPSAAEIDRMTAGYVNQ